jgi:UDP-N-acetylmuramate dehydrogenase
MAEVPPTSGPSSDVPLAPLLTLGTGGSARWFCAVSTEPELEACLAWARQRRLPVLILGGGSNLICADEGFHGLVVKIELGGIEVRPLGPKTLVVAGAGVTFDALVEHCCAAGLAGLECLSGVPGTVGATPIQNVGAYGQDVSQTLAYVRCLDRETGQVSQLARTECDFGYRTSRFKNRDRDRFVVLEVAFELTPNGAPLVVYPELRGAIAERVGAQPTLEQVRQCVLQLRASKSMLLDASDPNGRSCGSFFLNPVLEADRYERLVRDVAPQLPPAFEAGLGRVKVPAAWLIERAGFCRGHREGNAGLSTRHTLCVVAHPGATSGEVIGLARKLRDAVKTRYGITLEPEPVLVGIDW